MAGDRRMDWKTLLASITGTVDQELLLRHEYLDVRFISSLPVMQWTVCKAWVDSKPVQMVWGVDSTRLVPDAVGGGSG